MTNFNPEPRPPRDERNDELIASIVAFSVIGVILYWGLGRGDRSPILANLDTPPDIESLAGLRDEFDLESEGLNLDADASEFTGRVAPLPFGGAPAVDLDESELESVSPLVDDEELTDSPRVIRSLSRPQSSIADPSLGAAVVAPPAAEELVEEDIEDPVTEAPVTEAPVTEEDPEQAALEEADPVPVAVEEPLPEDPATVEDDAPASFLDVAPDYWATPFIAGLSQAEAIRGFGDGNFQPNQPITRAEFASLLNQAFAPAATAEPVPYTDVTADYWAAEAIAQVTNAGFMSGYPQDDFRPDQQVTRLEVLIALVSGLELPSPAETASLLEVYQDRDQIADWAVPRIAAATDAGLVVNHPEADQLNPNQSATRAEAAAMIYQALAQQNQVEPVESPFIVER